MMQLILGERTTHPVKPTDSSMIELFNSHFGEKCLKESWFLFLEDAREKIEKCGRFTTG